MNISYKKMMSVLIVAIMLVLTACGNNTNEAKVNNEPKPGSTTNEAPDTVEPMTLSFYSEDINPQWANMQDDIGKYITEKTGITIDPEFAVGDAVQKTNLIAASGQYHDLMAPKGSHGVLIEAGAMLDLTDLIEEHAPNIKALLGDQINRLRYSAEDPSIYFIPNQDTIGQIYFDAGDPSTFSMP